MCGIVGVLRFGENPIVPSFNMSALYLATSLLESSETRGPDATGVTAVFDNGNFFIQKMAIGAAEFVTRSGGKSDDYEGLMAILRGYNKAHMRCFLGHCRKKSAGALSNVDNHPIKAGNIVGVHNGTLKNDKEIFKNLGCDRDGTVDSEAIFRLLQFYTNDCAEPFTKEAVVEVCTRLEGTYSLLGYNANNPYQVVSAKDGRPAEYCLIKPLGIVLIASETKFIDRALWNYNKQARLWPTGNPETTFVALTKNDIESVSLANDTVAVFDLTKEVTPDTKLADLYETAKVPFQVKPNWKSAVTKTYGGGFNNMNNNTNTNSAAANKGNYSNGFSGGKAGSEKKGTTNTSGQHQSGTAGQKPGADGKSTELSGSVWDQKLDSLVKVFGRKDIITHGIVADVESGKHAKINEAMSSMTLDSADADEAKKTPSEADRELASGDVAADDYTSDNKLTFTKKMDDVEDYTPGRRVPIVRIKPAVKTDATIEDMKKGIAKVTNSVETATIEDMKKGIAKVTNSVETPKKANEAAIAAVKKLEKFADDDELATFIGLDTESLDQLPLASLANRIKKYLFAEFFVAGWEACSKEKATASYNDAGGEKLAKAMKHIRVLKHLNTSLDSIVEILSAEEIDEGTIGPGVRLVAAALSSKHGEIRRETLNEIFNSGDFRKSKLLRGIVSNID